MYPAIIAIQPAVLLKEVKDDSGVVKNRVFQSAYDDIVVRQAAGINIIATSPIFAFGVLINSPFAHLQSRNKDCKLGK